MAALGGPVGIGLAGADLLLGFLSDRSKNKLTKQQSQLQGAQFEENRGDTMAQAIAQFLQGLQTQRQQQATTGLQSTQMDPYAQAKALNNANIKAQFAAGFQPGQGFSGHFSTPAFSPESLANASEHFNKYAAAASPNVPTGDPGAEVFRQQYNTQQQQLQDQIMAFLKQIGQYRPMGNNPLYPQMNMSTFPSMPGANVAVPRQPGTRAERGF